MGRSLKSGDARRQLDALESDTRAAARDKALDEAQAVLDAAGIVDPTPLSDLASAVISAGRGDWLGAGLSLVSAIPYAGDAVAKTSKGARLVARLAEIEKRIADNVVKARQITAHALKGDAARLRASKAAAKAKRIAQASATKCPVGGNAFGTHAPRKGWQGEAGDSLWDPAKAGYERGRLDQINSVTRGAPIRFTDGYPDFSPYVGQVRRADGGLVPARVEIPMTGQNGPDFAAARQAMADKLNLASFEEPRGYTWHHHQDGVTMELIPSKLHNNVPHSGGASLARDPGY